jgi:aminobenzoyl-glutamate transport protein
MQRFLDVVERVGNMVPHPVVIFLILIAIVIVLSAILGVVGTAVTFERINPETHKVETAESAIRSLLTAAGIRFMYESLIPNFMSFTAVGLMIGAMIGAGVAEESGLVGALIRKLVLVSPAWSRRAAIFSSLPFNVTARTRWRAHHASRGRHAASAGHLEGPRHAPR